MQFTVVYGSIAKWKVMIYAINQDNWCACMNSEIATHVLLLNCWYSFSYIRSKNGPVTPLARKATLAAWPSERTSEQDNGRSGMATIQMDQQGISFSCSLSRFSFKISW